MSEQLYDFEKIKAIIGLGNPGHKYYLTRHNIGFRVVDVFADRYDAQWSDAELMQHTSIFLPESTRSIVLVKPLTFMNNAGKIVPFLIKKGISSEEILVVHDELEKPFGKMSLRLGGSARGHNGLRSIMGVIGESFWRLRFGIGRPEDKSQVGNYVLSRFFPEEEQEVSRLLEQAIVLLEGGNR